MKLSGKIHSKSARKGAETQRVARKSSLRSLCAFAALRECFSFFDKKHFVLMSLCAILFAFPNPSSAQLVLSAIEKTVSSQFDVPHLTWQELQTRLHARDSLRYVLFDTRPLEEYNVSHLPRAIQIEPHLSSPQFFAQYGDSLKNKVVVFYCSVGYRSSQFLQRVHARLQEQGVAAFNLQGGIFRWFNEGNRVVNAQGTTNAVHPYDKIWGGLLKERKPVP